MPSVPKDQVSTYARRLLSARRVADRYSVNIRTLARWVRRGVIPAASEVICSRRYWHEERLDEADRARTVAAGKAGKATTAHSPPPET